MFQDYEDYQGTAVPIDCKYMCQDSNFEPESACYLKNHLLNDSRWLTTCFRNLQKACQEQATLTLSISIFLVTFMTIGHEHDGVLLTDYFKLWTCRNRLSQSRSQHQVTAKQLYKPMWVRQYTCSGH